MDTGTSIFIIGLLMAAIALTVFIFVFKRQYWSLLSSVLWVILAFNRFNAALVQWDTNYNLGLFATGLAVFCGSTFFWSFKPDTTSIVNEDKREAWEIEDEKRAKRIKRLSRYRPKKKRRPYGDWGIDV